MTSANAKGFAVISENITSASDYLSKDEKIKKVVYFCMIHDISALCGVGSLVRNVNGVEVDFSPYILKSLETIKIGVNTSDE
ncbi:hypothetical protein EK69_004519 [Salmonella enterica subsp. enterica]|nr:hypothetical protein [Salmonella enterica subsp. enterica serovar Baguida]